MLAPTQQKGTRRTPSVVRRLVSVPPAMLRALVAGMQAGPPPAAGAGTAEQQKRYGLGVIVTPRGLLHSLETLETSLWTPHVDLSLSR